MRLPRILRVSSLVTVRVAACAAELAALPTAPFVDVELLFLPVTAPDTAVPTLRATLAATAVAIAPIIFDPIPLIFFFDFSFSSFSCCFRDSYSSFAAASA